MYMFCDLQTYNHFIRVSVQPVVSVNDGIAVNRHVNGLCPVLVE